MVSREKQAKVPVKLVREAMMYAEEGHDIGSRGLWESARRRTPRSSGGGKLSLDLLSLWM